MLICAIEILNIIKHYFERHNEQQHKNALSFHFAYRHPLRFHLHPDYESKAQGLHEEERYNSKYFLYEFQSKK